MAYRCATCQTLAPIYSAQCPHPQCGAWNTMKVTAVKERIEVIPPKRAPRPMSPTLVGVGDLDDANDPRDPDEDTVVPNAPIALTDVSEEDCARVTSGLPTLDRVLGGGFVAGSATMIAGNAGLGKSSLVNQMLALGQWTRALYVTGEETVGQVALRARRIDAARDHVFVVAETDVDTILAHVEQVRPEIVVIDSIQKTTLADLNSAAGTVTQITGCIARLVSYAKSSDLILVVVCHITKDGAIAGPKALEHDVDVVLVLEKSDDDLSGDARPSQYRRLVSHKNRFGSTSEIGAFEMTALGMRGIERDVERDPRRSIIEAVS